jgi:hypothetical protein
MRRVQRDFCRSRVFSSGSVAPRIRLHRMLVFGVVLAAGSGLAAPVASAAPIPYSVVGGGFGPQGRTPANFSDPREPMPLNIAATAQGDVFVQQGSAVRRFDRDGDLISMWDTALLETSLRGVAADSQGNVYLADAAKGRVLKYSLNGTLLDQWLGHGEAPGEAAGSGSCPSGIATDPNGNVYLTCGQAGWFEKLSPTGELQAHSASCLIGPIAARTDGSVLVTDCGTIRMVLQYGPSGVRTIGKRRPLGGDENAFAAPGEFGPWRPGPRVFVSGGAAGLAIDSKALLWVADPDNHRVQAFQADGHVVATCRPPAHSHIEVVAAGTDGELYISDFVRVQRIAPTSSMGSSCGTRVKAIRLPQRRALLSPERAVAVRLRCATAGDPCRGKLRVTTVLGTRLGAKHFELGPGTTNVRVRLSRRASRALRRRGSLRIRLSATIRSTLDGPVVARKQLTLQPGR